MYSFLQKLLTRLSYLLIIVVVVGFLRKDRLPDYKEIDTALHSSPVQQIISAPSFQIEYKDRRYEVRPRALYELKGLIVSQNNPTGFADIYHDSSSIDTKDFCVIWGHNVRSNEFKEVTYWSGAWTCYCKWDDAGLRFWTEQLSNNHLITDNDAIREKIAKVGIGDQVHIKGMLVDYRELIANGGWRNTSLVRTDDGNGACEVLFVKKLTILRNTNLFWRQSYQYALLGLITAAILKFVLFLAFSKKPGEE
jgi:hypothetical protein